MRQTSLRALSKSRRNRGITLIELCTVVVVILIMAALAERSFAHVKDGLAQRAFVSSLRSEIVRGHLQAIQDGQIVMINYDPAGSQFTLTEPQVQDANSTQTPELVTDLQSQTFNTIHTLPIPAGITFADFKAGATDQGSGSWQLHFYPDGKSDGGGVQLTIGRMTESIKIDTHGQASIQSDPLPDSSNDIWATGTYDQRAAS